MDLLRDKDELKKHEVEICYENAIRTLTAEQLRSLTFNNNGPPNMDAVPHTIFLAKRMNL